MTTVNTLNEMRLDELIQRIINGEIDLYEEIVRMYDKYLYKVGRSYGFGHQTTEDMMQETFVNAFLHLKDFENRSSFKTWIVKIMLHQCYYKKHRSKFRREIAVDGIGEGTKPVFTSTPDKPEHIVSNHELKENLEKAIVKIPEQFRNVFTLRELDGLNVRETADALNITESNVKVRLSRAKAMLRTQLEKMYMPEEIFEFNLIHCTPLVEGVMQTIKEIRSANGLAADESIPGEKSSND